MTDETIFAAALEKSDPAGRAAYLDDACRGDPDQRRRLAALLAAHDKAAGFLERPPVAAVDPETAPTRAFAAPEDTRTLGEAARATADDALSFLSPPRRPDSFGRIGHYEVLQVLGRGGFGIVFRAFDEVLQRVVAVKVLSPQMAATSPARKRFLREARSSAAVRHENVVQVHAVEESPLPYLVMEFIPGETLQQRLDRTGPLDVPEVLALGRQVAEGLAAAHATGLIHRDIKPANVMVDAGPHGRVKITDFGLARAADDASISQSGVVAGTPLYMAPEQARGEALDHRADLFSLGSVLYAVLTGRPPFRAETTLAVLKRVADDAPRPIQEIIPEVPEWLCRVVGKLHAKNPDDRFQSAREVADVLADCEKQLQAHKELRDYSRIPGGKPEPKRRRWPRRVAAVVGVLFLSWAAFVLGGSALLYARGLCQIEVSGHEIDSVMLLRDGEPVADAEWTQVTPNRWRVKVPPGRYTVEVKPNGNQYIQELATATDGPFFSQTGDSSRDSAWNDLRASVTGGQRRRFAKFPGTVCEVELDRGERARVSPSRTGPPARPQPPKDSDGFVPLFNGKDLTGWTPSKHSPGLWRVEGGVLVGRNGPGYLFSAGSYENFHLRVEARVNADGNSGVGFRRVFQSEILNDPLCPTGTLLEVDPTKTTPLAHYPRKAVPADEWFTLEIRAEGASLSARVNDGPWVAARDGRPESARSGPLELEAADPGTVIQFRKIEIKELPPADGFVPLFNGKDLTGWHGTADKYFVTKDGTLLANPIQNEYGMLRTARSYENYELRLQCRPSGQLQAGSQTRGGVVLHATDEGNPTQPKPGLTIWITSGRAPDVKVSGEDRLQGVQKFEKTKGPVNGWDDGWNELRVVRQGQTVTIFYNGERRWSCDRCRPGKGNIGLWAQDGDVQFRNIEIRELPPAKDAPNPAVLQPLKDAVAAKERARDAAKQRFDADVINKIELLAAEADLTESRVALAEAEGDKPAVVARLEEAVKYRQEERDLIAERVRLGADAPNVLDQADARLAEAKTRLAKAKPTAPAPRPKP